MSSPLLIYFSSIPMIEQLNKVPLQTNRQNFSVPTKVQTKNILLAQEKTPLPIDEKKEEILNIIQNNDELIITAETGAGKSTRVPQFLAKAGYKVIVTQPRILAAMSLADRVAEEMGGEVGKEVGYHVGGQVQNSRKFSPETKIKFCTDGLQLVKQLMDKSILTSDEKTVLVIDEVHEWNQNIEVLVAWAKRLKTLGKKMKVILMSATIDSDRLVQYFSTLSENSESTEIHKQPQILEVVGRNYPVERSQDTASNLNKKIIELVKEKRNVLVFQPGKQEIATTI
jgi:HrpA-like RNA helicase